jgi:hypothetical protein
MQQDADDVITGDVIIGTLISASRQLDTRQPAFSCANRYDYTAGEAC